jgi:hypothetical protein
MEDARIIKLLAEISKDLKKAVSLLEDARHELPAGKEWIDRLDVEKMLGVSESTIKRFTADGTLEARRIGQKNWYFKSDIFKHRDKFLK